MEYPIILAELYGMPITMYAVFVVVSLVCAILCLYLIRKRYGVKSDSILKLSVIAIPIGMVLSRGIYVLCRFEHYSAMNFEPVLHLWEGGYMLWGALFGVLIAAMIVSRQDRVPLLTLTDLLSAPTALAIAIGRAAEFTDGQGKGAVLSDESLFRFFPVAFITDRWGDETEWSLSVFVFECAAALILFVILMNAKRGTGQNTALFVILYCSSQIYFEQLRCDSFPRWLFVRISQLICVVVLFIFDLYRLVQCHKQIKGKDGEFKKKACLLIPFLMAAGICIVCEFALDGKLPFISYTAAYIAMAAACICFAFTSYGICIKNNE